MADGGPIKHYTSSKAKMASIESKKKLELNTDRLKQSSKGVTSSYNTHRSKKIRMSEQIVKQSNNGKETKLQSLEKAEKGNKKQALSHQIPLLKNIAKSYGLSKALKKESSQSTPRQLPNTARGLQQFIPRRSLRAIMMKEGFSLEDNFHQASTSRTIRQITNINKEVKQDKTIKSTPKIKSPLKNPGGAKQSRKAVTSSYKTYKTMKSTPEVKSPLKNPGRAKPSRKAVTSSYKTYKTMKSTPEVKSPLKNPGGAKQSRKAVTPSYKTMKSTPKVKSPLKNPGISKLKKVIKEFRQKHKESIVKADFVYEFDRPENVFILAYVNHPNKTKEWEMYNEYKVLFVDYLYVNSEAVRVAFDKQASKLKLSEISEKQIRKTITKHADELMSLYSNLEIISGSPVRSKQKGQEILKENCIVLFCRNKGYIPVEEKPFPTEIDGIAVDVREGFFQWSPSESQLANEYQDLLRMGCSIGSKGNPVKGSLGGFDDTGSGMGFITCAHVLYTAQELRNPSTIHPNRAVVVQPADSEIKQNDTRDRECGTVLNYVYDPFSDVGVDCAVVKITKRQPKVAEFCNIDDDSLRKAGFEPNHLLRYTSGKIIENPSHMDYRDRRLIKCGRSTGLRRGVFEFDGAAVNIKDVHLSLDRSASNVICLKGQYEVLSIGGRSFVEDGDSGALVFLIEEDNSLSCIGMVEGWTSYFSSVITPITAILKKLQLDPERLCAFPEDIMDTE